MTWRRGPRRAWRAEDSAAAALAAGLLAFPFYASAYKTLNMAYFLSLVFLSLSLALIWGYAGIFSFGQAAFFGIGGYLFGILAINFGRPDLTPAALVLAVLGAAAAAGVLGYFMFYGGVNDVFVGLTTMAVTLVLETFMAQTAGPQWKLGKALLGGFNGMKNIPPLAVGAGQHVLVLQDTRFFYFVLVLLVALYLGLRRLLGSRWGHALVAIREHRERTETFGYNVRLIQCQVFALGGALAGLSGALYTIWGGYITPSSMGLTAASMPVILVAAGGRKNLTAAIVSTLVLSWVSQQLSASGSQYALVALGTLLLAVVLLAPEGFVAALFQWVNRRLDRRRAPAPAGVPEQGGDLNVSEAR